MGHANIWYSHPRKYGRGSREWLVIVIDSIEIFLNRI